MQFNVHLLDGTTEGLDDWFTQYVGLGLRLGRLIDSQDVSQLQALLLVPNRAFVAPALCLGLSLQRFQSQKDLGEILSSPSELDQYVGRRIRIELPRRYVIGDIRDFEIRQNGDVRVKLEPPIDETIGLRRAKSVTLLPIGFPVGTYDITPLEELGARRATSPNLERFKRQGAPTAIVFGKRTTLLEELDVRVHSGSLDEVLSDEPLSLLELARFDHLSLGDKYPHFVNVVESTTKFPESDSHLRAVVDMFKVQVFDGNNAIDKLVCRDEVKSLMSLSIFDLGDSELSDNALAAFRASTLYSRPTEITELAEWVGPEGTQLSLFERQ